MLRPEVLNISRTGRPTNFKLGTQTEPEDPVKVKVKGRLVEVARSRDASDRCWPISRERNILATPKLVRSLFTPRAIMRKRSKVKLDYC